MENRAEGIFNAARNLNRNALNIGETAFKLFTPKPIRRNIYRAQDAGREFLSVFSNGKTLQKIEGGMQGERQQLDDLARSLSDIDDHDQRSALLRRIGEDSARIVAIPEADRSEDDKLRLKIVATHLAEMPVYGHPAYRLGDETVMLFDDLVRNYAQ